MANDFSLSSLAVVLVSKYPENRGQLIRSMTYTDFSKIRVSKDDQIIIAWKELGAGLPVFECNPVLPLIENNLRISNRVLYLSSGAVYGNSDMAFNEKIMAAPQGSYARAKFEIESWLTKTTASNAIICRVSNVFGLANLPNLINKIIDTLNVQERLQLFNPDQFSRDYISIESLTRFVRFLTFEHKINSAGPEIVNVSSNISLKTATILEGLNHILGYEIHYDLLDTPPEIPARTCLNNEKLLTFSKFPTLEPLHDILNYFDSKIWQKSPYGESERL
jgi:nucleoside-diphosphate-sugar epimerase